ncbi:MAG: hypothetical protein RLY20_14 [Verrucomicrobiota bacterium]
MAVSAFVCRADNAVAAAAPSTSEAGFQLSLTPEIALHSTFTHIHGVSLGVWGENPQTSLTLGIVNGSREHSSGLSLALGVNYAESYEGVQWGLVNISKTSFTGWQSGAINYSQGSFVGLQSGFVNVAEDVNGLQWGCVNYTEKMKGAQIGFLNIIRDNGWFDRFPDKLATAFPFVNWSF